MLYLESQDIDRDDSNILVLGSENVLPEEDNTQGSLVLINELLEDIKKNMTTHALESAILLLRDALNEDDQHTDIQNAARRYLIMALSTRFFIHGWIEDFDECFMLSSEISAEYYFHLHSTGSEDGHQDNGNIRMAADLIRECRLSIDVRKLSTAMCIAKEALGGCGEGELTNQIEFHMHLGNALVMHSLFYGGMEPLRAASRHFRTVGGLREACTSRYASFIALAHIGLLKSTEGRDIGGMKEMLSHMESAREEDREGLEAFKTGTQLLKANELQEAVQCLSVSLLHRVSPHPRRAASLENLGCARLTQFKQLGEIHNLEESIWLHRESLSLRPPPHPDRSMSLNNVASAVRARFEQKGDIQDLEEAILLHRESLLLTPPPHPDRCRSLNNLANSVWTRFQQKGDIQDLEEAILLHRESLLLMPPPHPDRSMSLNNLAGAVRTRFQQKGDIQDLEEAIMLHRESLSLMPPPHPLRSGLLNNLANSVRTRFKEKGDIQDLEEAILLHRESLMLRPPPHPGRSTSLNNLASVVQTRFEQKGDIQDLEESIQLHRESLVLRPPPHPDRSGSLNNLAYALITRFDISGSSDDLKTAFNYYSAASQYDSGSLFDRLRYSKAWALYARKHSHPSVLDAYQCAVAILPRLASLDLNLRQRQSVLTHAREVTSDAAQCAIDQESLDTAVVFLSIGRSVFWSQGLHLRTPLDRLAEKEPELAEQIHSASRRLENAAYAPRDSDRTPDVSTSDVTGLSNLVKVRNEALEKTRQIEGFEDFLLPPSFNSIQKAARHGPIVMLNASQYGCDALILRHAEVPVERVHLVWMDLALLMVLKDIVQRLSWGDNIEARAIDDVKCKMRQYTAATSASGIGYQLEAFLDVEDSESMQRHQGVGLLRRHITNQSAFRSVLGLLWTTIVEPVLETLKQEKV